MTILALDKDTVKVLTTSQIITSISTAAKELIENALDAGCKHLEIKLTDKGCSLIEVKDDGCGVSTVDAPYMTLPSCTSKISSFSDLDSLETYGFRGEALYALSAVSNLTIITKTENDIAATSYVIDHCGRITKSEICHRSTGTTVQVRDLFKHQPVRRQIITNSKKAAQNVKTLESLIKSYGMCKFSVRINYRVDNTVIFAKREFATLEDAVAYTLGRKITSNMSWIDIADVDIEAKVMVPSKAPQNISEVFQSDAQYIFVNNRPIKYKELEKTVIKIILEGIGQDSSSRKKPVFVLHILINPGNLDVNLEPNKTSILFKEQNVVFNTIGKCLENWYGIEKEAQEENNCDVSMSEYKDYSQKKDTNDVESVVPVCKKPRLEMEENINKVTKKNANENENMSNLNSINSECNRQVKISKNEQNCQSENVERNNVNNNENVDNLNSERNGQAKISTSEQDHPTHNKMVNDLNVELPALILSDSDSNDSQNFPRDSVNNAVKEEDNSPPLELTQGCETLSQLPIVDLGEDFEWDECNYASNDKENICQNITNPVISHKKTNLNSKKSGTLDEWSKGHVPGLKGGTDINVCNYVERSESPKNDMDDTNVCKGFSKYSEHIRPEVVEKMPNLTAAQLAHTITTLWKNLPPEERGYYRDLARDEILRHNDTKQEETIKKKTVDVNTNKSRLLKAFEKMKTFNLEKTENLVMRTTVPWDINLMKVTKSFRNGYSDKSTNLVVGRLDSNLWIVNKSSHIWILDAEKLKKGLQIFDENMNEDDANGIEQLLEKWFLEKDDLSFLYPIHSLT